MKHLSRTGLAEAAVAREEHGASIDARPGAGRRLCQTLVRVGRDAAKIGPHLRGTIFAATAIAALALAPQSFAHQEHVVADNSGNLTCAEFGADSGRTYVFSQTFNNSTPGFVPYDDAPATISVPITNGDFLNWVLDPDVPDGVGIDLVIGKCGNKTVIADHAPNAEAEGEFAHAYNFCPQGNQSLANVTFCSDGIIDIIPPPLIPTFTIIDSDGPDPSLPLENYIVSYRVVSTSVTPTGSVTITSNDGLAAGTCNPGGLAEDVPGTAIGNCTLASPIGAVGLNNNLTAVYNPTALFAGSQDTENHTIGAVLDGGADCTIDPGVLGTVCDAVGQTVLIQTTDVVTGAASICSCGAVLFFECSSAPIGDDPNGGDPETEDPTICDPDTENCCLVSPFCPADIIGVDDPPDDPNTREDCPLVTVEGGNTFSINQGVGGSAGILSTSNTDSAGGGASSTGAYCDCFFFAEFCNALAGEVICPVP